MWGPMGYRAAMVRVARRRKPGIDGDKFLEFFDKKKAAQPTRTFEKVWILYTSGRGAP